MHSIGEAVNFERKWLDRIIVIDYKAALKSSDPLQFSSFSDARSAVLEPEVIYASIKVYKYSPDFYHFATF